MSQSREDIETLLGQTPMSFPPPYGHSSAAVRAAIGKLFQASVGTCLQCARRRYDFLNVQRIKMHCVRDRARWETYLDGRAGSCFESRRALRRARQMVVEHSWS